MKEITTIPMPLTATPKKVEYVMASPEQRRHALAASQSLLDTFLWHDTVEGSKFWDAIYERLEGIGRGEQPLRVK